MKQKLICISFVCATLGFGQGLCRTSFDYTTNNDLSAQHCPLSGSFAVATIRPMNGAKALVCRNRYGAIYHYEEAQISVEPQNSAWVAQKYPPSVLCWGQIPEDCPYFRHQ